MTSASLELSLVVQVPEGMSVDDLSVPFYEQFDGVIAELAGRTHMTLRSPGDDGCSTAIDAILQVEAALNVCALEIDWDLVDMTEIASRMGVTRANVHQLVTGQRADGTFPAPMGVPSGHRVWDWASVNEWLRVYRPSAWSGVRSLARDDMRRLDAWLLERRQRIEPVIKATEAATQVTRIATSFLRLSSAAGETSGNRPRLDLVS